VEAAFLNGLKLKRRLILRAPRLGLPAIPGVCDAIPGGTYFVALKGVYGINDAPNLWGGRNAAGSSLRMPVLMPCSSSEREGGRPRVKNPARCACRIFDTSTDPTSRDQKKNAKSLEILAIFTRDSGESAHLRRCSRLDDTL
jgi:hypothetical protein